MEQNCLAGIRAELRREESRLCAALKDSRFVDAPGGFRLAEDVSGEGRSKTEASIQSSG